MARCEACKQWGVVCSDKATNPQGQEIEKPDGKGRFVSVETPHNTVFLYSPSPIEECPVVTGQDLPESYAPVIKAGAAHIARQLNQK